jgi:hypothetical protein
MKKIYYEKIGRKYVPVREYDGDFLDSVPKGTHIIMCYPGGQSTRYNIEPNYAAMIAAGRLAEDAICNAIYEASQYKTEQQPLTEGQIKAWQNLKKEFGEEISTLRGASTRDIAEAGVRAMQEAALKLMENPSVKLAYDQFQFMCELAKDHQNS